MRRTREDLIRVGIFTLLAGGILAGSLLWIAGSELLRPRDSYRVLFTHSVSGLNAGSNVQYQGVVVGRVRDIRLTEDIPPRVAVMIDLEPGTPVRRDTGAALLGSFVTGIQYIQLKGGSEAAGPLPPGGTIPGSVASLLDFRDRLVDISDTAITILSRLERTIFTEENAVKVATLASDLSEVASRLNRAVSAFDVERRGKEVAEMVATVAEAAEAVNQVFRDFSARSGRIYAGLGETLRDFDVAIVEARGLLREALGELRGTGSATGEVLENLSQVTGRLQETLDTLEADPSLLLRGRSIPDREFAR